MATAPTRIGVSKTVQMPDLGWWVISGEELLAALHRVHEGEDPDLAYAELYANSKVERHSDEREG